MRKTEGMTMTLSTFCFLRRQSDSYLHAQSDTGLAYGRCLFATDP